MLTLPEARRNAEETAASDPTLGDRNRSSVTAEVVTRPRWGNGPLAVAVIVAVIVAMMTAVWFSVFSPGPTHHDHDHDHDHTYTESVDHVVEPPLPVAAPLIGFDPATHVANYDASVIAAVDGPELVFNDGTSGELLATTKVDEGFELRALSATGTKAALVRPTTADDGTVTASEIAVVDRETGHTSRHHFDGRIDPEAFATDGQALFVIDHQVTGEPGSYRVRPLNLETGELEVILGPGKIPLTEDMNGRGRRQTWGFDDGRLYTLYIRQTDHVHASGRPGHAGFVHILDLDEEWAFCLDLPPTFGHGDLATTALAVDGHTIAVLDLAAGQLAYASVADRAVSHVIDLPTTFVETLAEMRSATPARAGAELPEEPTVHLALNSKAIAVGVGYSVAWFDDSTLMPLDEPTIIHFPLLGLSSLPGSVVAWPATEGHNPIELRRPIGS